MQFNHSILFMRSTGGQAIDPINRNANISNGNRAQNGMFYLIVFLILLPGSVLVSCKNNNLRAFTRQLDSADQKVSRIVALDSLESKRLKAVIGGNWRIAQNIGHQQIQELKYVIKQLELTDVAGSSEAMKLKKNYIRYYNCYIELKNLDIAEAAVLGNTVVGDSSGNDLAVSRISEIVGKRKKLYKLMSKTDSLRQVAKDRFIKTI